ncbi:hypothetical protein BST97_11665 [Nonlabens spongiae]|uniref:Uncharacterized protein n=1 Tax=Nonlabens spongiae TaxID=331648 RepID=A0A1W6MLW1_9FLAO|nr:hypothetical protein [Nonlabens spongiae]ARN78591.1 hypothetical protein BST97_11665 [Nonlabens spongiae]
MKKKIAADLTSLAHRILQLKNKENVTELQAIAKELYEKLTVLAFTEKHFADAQPTAGNREVEERLEKAFAEAQENVGEVSDRVEKVMENAQEEVHHAFRRNDLSELFVPADEDEREEMDLPGISTIQKMVVEMPDEDVQTPEKKQQEEIPEPEATQEEPAPKKVVREKEPWEKLIEKVNKETTASKPQETTQEEPPQAEQKKLDLDEVLPKPEYNKNDFDEITADFKDMPVFERKVNDNSERPKSLNDRLNQGMKIGMNDRIGFVKHLFNGSTDDFNRVLSQLNTIPNLSEANNFIDNMVKPEYNNWDGKDAYEAKFKELVERNYG